MSYQLKMNCKYFLGRPTSKTDFAALRNLTFFQNFTLTPFMITDSKNMIFL